MLGRLTSKTWTSGSTAYATTYTYKNHPTDTNLTSTQLASIQNGSNPSIAYLYDANGNITSITESGIAIQYEYNELNEVIRENNQRDNKTFVYNYNLGGNLLSKVEYAYTTGTLGAPVDTIPYVYGNTNWKDLLTSFDGKAITYDAIGNPLTYDGGTFAWEGRKLTSFNKTGLAVAYTYNESGIRTSKTVNGIATSYRLSGDRVTFEQTGSDTIYYVYDTQGQLISIILNNVEYAYLRNAQNDIVGLIDSAGVQVVSYTYSTWGEVLSITGSLASTVGQQNPYRYRGYRYDSETGLYYLQSRYYNPQWGRFLNSDSSTDGGSGILGTNSFIYAANNPVNNSDPSGKWIVKDAIKWVAKNVARPLVKGIQKELAKSGDGTLTLGVNYASQYGHSVSLSGGVTMDKKGNIGLIATTCYGGGTPSISASAFASVTNAPSIYLQRGLSTQVGGSISYLGATGGYELSFLPAGDKTYLGSTFLVGITSPLAVPLEFHVEAGNSWVFGFNVFDAFEQAYVKIMEW